MRWATIAIAIVLGTPTVLGTQNRPECGSPCRERAAPPSQPPRLLVALDERNGKVLWRAKPHGTGGGHLDAKFVTHGLVIAEEFRCDSGDRAYQAGDVSVVAFEARTGRERWRLADYELAAGMFGRIDPPANDVATLPVRSTVDAHVALVEVVTGRVAGPFAAQPVAGSADLLLTVATSASTASASNRGIVSAIDRRTGAVRWTRNLGANLFALVLDPRAVVVAAGPIPDPGTDLGKAGGLEVLDTATGQRRWAAALMPAFGVELAAGRVVFQNLDHLRGVDAGTGQLVWDVVADGGVVPGRVPGDTLPVLGNADGRADAPRQRLSALDAAIGRIRWTRTFTGQVLQPGIASDRAILVGTDLRITAFDALDGHTLWHRATPSPAHVVVAGGGRVYVSGGCRVSSE